MEDTDRKNIGEIIKKLSEETTTMPALLSLLEEAEILKDAEAAHIKAGESAEVRVGRLVALTKEWSAETEDLCLSAINNSCLHSKQMQRQTQEPNIKVWTRECNLDSNDSDARQIMQGNTKDTTSPSVSKSLLGKKDMKTKDIGVILGALANISISIPEELKNEQKSDKDFEAKAENVQCSRDQRAATKSPPYPRNTDSKSKNIKSVLGAMANMSIGSIAEVKSVFEFNDESRVDNVTKLEPPVRKDSKIKLIGKDSKSRNVESVLGAVANFSISLVDGSRAEK